MRFIRLATAVALVALLMPGCVTTHVGKYIKEGNPSDYTELKADGTFVIEERGGKLAGDYEVHGETLTLLFGPVSLTGIIKGDKIIDNEGQAWVK